MRVQKVQNTYNTPFNAKLRILGKYFVDEEYKTLLKKADKIGYENDVIELNYTNYRDKSIEFLGQKQPDYLNKISSLLKAAFFPNDDKVGTEIYKEAVSGDSYKEFWTKENNIANRYLDILMKKYPNERLGISIIEN